MSKHIVIDARDYSSSTGRYVRNLLSNLEKIDQKNVYTVLLSYKDKDAYSPANPNFKSLVAPFAKFSLSEQFAFISFIKKLKPDLVHFAFTMQPVFYRGRKVTTVHDLTPLRFNLATSTLTRLAYPLKRVIYSLLLKSAVRTSSHIITGTDFVKQDLVKSLGVKDTKISVTLESADKIKEDPIEIKELSEKDFILYVGRAQNHKNIKGLILAFKLVLKNNPETILVLAGRKDKAYLELEQFIKKEQISNIFFTDFVSDAELVWLYKNCRSYVFPSFSEGFGLPGLEAMKEGAPVVSSNLTCLPEVYGDAALYFDPHNTEDMALKIDRVLNDNIFRTELINRGFTQSSKYSWERMAKQTLDVYEKIS